MTKVWFSKVGLNPVMLLGALWLALCSEAAWAESTAQAYLDRLEDYGLSGIILLAHGNEIVIHRALGLADKEQEIPNTTETYFDLASISKTFTGAAILFAEEQGYLKTTDPLYLYLGPLPGEKNLANVHHLATHKAGLVKRGYEGLAGDTRSAFIESVKTAPMESQPGERYRYTNAGSSLLAAVLEIATGKAWSIFLKDALFTPAGMETRFDPEVAALNVLIARGYAGLPPDTRTGLDTDFEWGTRGADGVYGRAVDVFNWVSFILRGDSMTVAARAKLLNTSEIEAYGWHSTMTKEGRPIIHKGGDSGLYTSQILFYPQDDITIIWLINDNRQRWRTVLNRSLSNLMSGQSVNVPEPIVTGQEADFGGISGTYKSNGGTAITIGPEGADLLASGDALATAVMLFPNGDAKYTGLDGRAGNWVEMSFKNNPDGVVLDVLAAGETVRYFPRQQQP